MRKQAALTEASPSVAGYFSSKTASTRDIRDLADTQIQKHFDTPLACGPYKL